MKKLLLGLTILASFSSFAEMRSENLQRWKEMFANGEITQQGFNKLVEKQTILDSNAEINIQNRTVEDMEKDFKMALDRGDITPLGYSKLVLKLDALKNL